MFIWVRCCFLCQRSLCSVWHVGLQVMMAVLLFGGVCIGFGAAMSEQEGRILDILPAFAPGHGRMEAIIGIAVLAPWAFAGFESISQSVEEFWFSPKKVYLVLFAAVMTAFLAYVFLALLADLLALINDLLEMSRMENGKLELEIVETDLEDLMKDVRDIFELQMERKGISYAVSPEKLKHRTVLCDVKRLSRILLNLVSNAYKFTPKGIRKCL